MRVPHDFLRAGAASGSLRAHIELSGGSRLSNETIALEILGTGEHTPAQRLPSSRIDATLDKPAGWIERVSGVRERGVAGPGETVLTMGASAARGALAAAGLAASELDAIVGVGSVPAQAIPCTASLLQRELGVGGSGIPAFDVNATCLGFLAALDLLAATIQTGRHRRVMIVASEKPSCGLDWEDARTSALFGDGAAAIVIGRSRHADAKLLATHFQTFGDDADLCRIRAGGTLLHPKQDLEAFLGATSFEMRGPQLYRSAAEVVPPFLETLLARANVTAADIDVWVPHQASGKALDHMQEALSLPADKLVRTLATHGNQVAASLPVALHRAFSSGQVRRGQTIALVGTGAGFSVGGAVLRV